ncbi:hypothetical protein RB195_006335 [Necator americanus]|uniref:ZP domain-containing protein n=1 Tax=Necator americanus TaxID=51031 RepID=A0ABR1BVZ3_NECAM
MCGNQPKAKAHRTLLDEEIAAETLKKKRCIYKTFKKFCCIRTCSSGDVQGEVSSMFAQIQVKISSEIRTATSLFLQRPGRNAGSLRYGYGLQKRPPYYTRPEDFKIPDYRPPKPQVPSFNPTFGPQFTPFRPPFQQQQQFFQNFRPPVQGNPFPPQPPRNPQFPSGPFLPHSEPSFIPPVNNGRQQWFVPSNPATFVPPNIAAYWEGASPIPPQGAYGPTPTTMATQKPMKPSVNPDVYRGTVPTQPAANPESYTTPSNSIPTTGHAETFRTHGWYNPTSTAPQRPPEAFVTVTDEVVDFTNPTKSIFDMEENPYTTLSTVALGEIPGTLITATQSTPTSTAESPTTLIFEDITKYFPEEGPLPPQSARTTGYNFDTERTTDLQFSSLTTPETPDDVYDHTDVVEDVGEGISTTVQSKPSDLEHAKSTYFPRPVSSQAYQPPGHLPEDFTQHIDVNFLKPNRTCTGPLCGIDSDKVSLYNPVKGGSKGPTLLISNAAKGDAARLGYIPPNPKLISEFTAPPSSTEYYNSNFVPGSINYPRAIPKGPHVFMPPQNFPAPPASTLLPPASYTQETTPLTSYSPTAKTIAPPTTTTEYTTTEAFISPSTTSTTLFTVSRFETTEKSTESTPEAFTILSTVSLQPEEGGATTLPHPIPWSPTYKTVPPSSTITPATGVSVEVSTPKTTFGQPKPSSATSPPTRLTGGFETTPSFSRTPSESQTTSSSQSTTPSTTTQYFKITAPSAPPHGTTTPTSTPETPSTTPSGSTPSGTTSALLSTTSKSGVMNRVRGKVHVVCKEEGIEFSATTLFPFTGQIFANERKRIPGCLHEIVNAVTPKVFLPFIECGVKNAGDQHDSRAQYHMQVVVVIQQGDGTSTVQSFMAQCIHQKILYNKQTLPRRIEEALEELRLVATKLEQKAPLPQVEMKIVVDEHHQLGPEVSEVDIGMPLAVQWKLLPESDAYGFHVKNCIVKDEISKAEHKMIDELGCSTDTSIFAHPHYDTYHDSASSHLWAFKVPDHTRLRIRCDVAICSDVPSSMTNISSCASIPTPPFCPDLITSPSNSILYDAEGAFLKRRRQIVGEMTQSVRATLCTGGSCDPQPLALERRCFDLYWVAASTGFSFASLIAAIVVHIVVKAKISRH